MQYKTPEAKRAKVRRYYQANREACNARNRVSKQKVRDFINGKKRGPCADCNQSYPVYVMDFDHVRGVKTLDIAKVRTMKTAKLEVLKCELVCSNCHRIRTHARRQL